MTSITRVSPPGHAKNMARRRSVPVSFATPVTGPACYHCRQAGQPVEPVILTLRATEQTPPGWPEELQIETYTCIDRVLCRRITMTYVAVNARVH